MSAQLQNGAARVAGKWPRGVARRQERLRGTPTGVVSELPDFTIATWVYLNADPAWARVFDFGTTGIATCS